MLAAIGPVLGGWLIDVVGWRAIFLINLPLAAGAILLALIYVHDSRERDRPALDIPGAALATVALGALTWGLTLGSGHNGWTIFAVANDAGGVVSCRLCPGREPAGRRRDDAADLVRLGQLRGLTLLTLLVYGALGALIVLLPYVLIQAVPIPARRRARAAAFPLVMSLVSPVMGAIAGRIGARLPLTLGPLVVAAGFLLALRIGRAIRIIGPTCCPPSWSSRLAWPARSRL